MQIIKDQQIIANNWQYIADNDSLPTGNITVSLTRWLQNQVQLQQHTGQIGVRIEADADINLLTKNLTKITLIELNFPAFTDGRGFSQARLLRDNLQYQGELRAIGNYMLDQVFYLTKVGVNAFALKTVKELETALSTMQDFSYSYQN